MRKKTEDGAAAANANVNCNLKAEYKLPHSYSPVYTHINRKVKASGVKKHSSYKRNNVAKEAKTLRGKRGDSSGHNRGVGHINQGLTVWVCVCVCFRFTFSILSSTLA